MMQPAPERPTIGVGVVILRAGDDGRAEVVLIRRGHGLRAGQWSIPGGKQEAFETVRGCAPREAREETGLKVAVTGFLDVIDLIDREAGAHHTLIDFAAQAVGGTLRAGSDATAARWVPLAEAIEMVEWAQTRRVLRRACSGPLVSSGES